MIDPNETPESGDSDGDLVPPLDDENEEESSDESWMRSHEDLIAENS